MSVICCTHLFAFLTFLPFWTFTERDTSAQDVLSYDLCFLRLRQLSKRVERRGLTLVGGRGSTTTVHSALHHLTVDSTDCPALMGFPGQCHCIYLKTLNLYVLPPVSQRALIEEQKFRSIWQWSMKVDNIVCTQGKEQANLGGFESLNRHNLLVDNRMIQLYLHHSYVNLAQHWLAIDQTASAGWIG